MGTELGERLVRAIAARDALTLHELISPKVASGAELVDDVILGTWFEDTDHIDEIESIESATVVDRHRIGYRFRITNPSGTFEVEQQAYYDVADDKISWLRVICSGFRRVREPATA